MKATDHPSPDSQRLRHGMINTCPIDIARSRIDRVGGTTSLSQTIPGMKVFVSSFCLPVRVYFAKPDV